MKNINIFKIVILLFTVSLFVACDEGGEPDPGATATVEMAGDWYVKLLVDGSDIYSLGYYQFSTYNTASNDGTQMWFDDHELWPSKVKANIDLSAMTFSGSQLENEYFYTSGGVKVYPTLDITNGVIIKKGTVAPSGTVVDSISFNVEFSDDPGTIYQVAGYKRTGFLEDEH
ncbi:lipid-binding protein [Mariniflexile sp. HMF6888]|uniref:lipid-binding protein n=1 Tax=Mariniflexile sp. HMF6888 TaxID=3373086 RepID=UPI0037B3D9BE